MGATGKAFQIVVFANTEAMSLADKNGVRLRVKDFWDQAVFFLFKKLFFSKIGFSFLYSKIPEQGDVESCSPARLAANANWLKQ